MSFKIKRLDHHGIGAGIIDDLQIVPLLDKYLPQDEKQEITPDEAVKGMIMNGIGFANRSLSLSPQFLLTSRLSIYSEKVSKPVFSIGIS
jgi:hypothetical protein